MQKVFIDTFAWISLVNTRDIHHTSVLEVLRNLRQQRVLLITTEFVLLEVADALCKPNLRPQTIDFINRLRSMNILQIIPVSTELFASGWRLYCQRNDKDWGLTDCISFVVMKQQNITLAFTSDRHFVQAGFTKLI